MLRLIYSLFCVAIGVLISFYIFTQTEFGLQNVKPTLLTKLSFADGGSYVGDVNSEGILSGKGRLSWENSSYYEGQFDNGLFNGLGKYNYPDGALHEGEYVNGVAHGSGKIEFPSGDVYEGEFEQGLMHGIGKIMFADTSIYEGEFVTNVMQGRGKLIIPGESVYVGEIKRGGMMHGKGQIIYDNGDKYTGNFRDNMLSGQGVYTRENGDIYSGEFYNNDFTGQGTFTSESYGTIVGQFEKWYADGEGLRSDSNANQWKGTFNRNQLHGEGEYIGADGEYYTGSFEYGHYSGEGHLIDEEGNQYWGSFSHSQKNGKGKFEYKEAFEGLKTYSGTWRYGKLVEDEGNRLILPAEKISEFSLYNQQRLLEESLKHLSTGDKYKPDLYLLGIAGWGEQEVFHREINYIEKQFDELFNTQDRSVFLVNSQRNIKNRPLATITSIEKTIQRFSKVMDKNEDILFLYATSHGTQEEGFSLGQKGLSLQSLSVDALGKMLKDSAIKYKVVVISACYSGGFIDALKDEYSLIITSAAINKKSFGCSDNRLFTYFGKAFFEKSLKKSESFLQAFSQAEILIKEWEKNESVTPSEPMLYTTNAIQEQLKQWRKSLAKSN